MTAKLLSSIRCLFLCFLAAIIFAQTNAQAQVRTVANSDSSVATSDNSQRRTFYDADHGLHWLFYSTSSSIKYSYSIDGSSWVAAGTINYEPKDFSLTFKTIGSSSYVFLVIERRDPDKNFDILLIRGEVRSNSIAFGDPITVFDSQDRAVQYLGPTVALDENNYVWVAAVQSLGEHEAEYLRVYARRSTNKATGNLSQWKTATGIGRISSLLKSLILMPLDGSEMYLVANTDAPNIVGYLYNGSEWVSANNGSDFEWFRFGQGFKGEPKAIAISGRNLYIGGDFRDARGDPTLDYIVHWDGVRWRTMGEGLNGAVYALVMYDGELYAGGAFTNVAKRIARWDGSQWHKLADGVSGTVRAIAFHDDELYIAGDFVKAGATEVNRVARWDGGTWNELGDGLNDSVYALASFQGDLYAGGQFVNAGGSSKGNRIARWDGANWLPLGNGFNSVVYTLTLSSDTLFAGGSFSDAGGDPDADRIAKWNGSQWQALAPGAQNVLNGTVFSLAFSRDGVYAAGAFTDAGGEAEADYIALWNGTQWRNLDSPGFTAEAKVVAIYRDDVYLGGTLFKSCNKRRIARWDGKDWHFYGFGGLDNTVKSIVTYKGDVYIGGAFLGLGSTDYGNAIARWDGISWQPLDRGLITTCTKRDPVVNSMTVWNGYLYVGGDFDRAVPDSGIPIEYSTFLVKWDGEDWSTVGRGVNGEVHAVFADNDGVYVGGEFGSVNESNGDETIAMRFALWGGSNWSVFSGGCFEGHCMAAGGIPNGTVKAIALYDNTIYIGGSFKDVYLFEPKEEDYGDYILAWNKADPKWQPVDIGLNGAVNALMLFDGELYIGGAFDDAGGNVNADHIVSWDGINWNALGLGLASAVNAFYVDDDKLYVGGNFSNAGNDADADKIAIWDGAVWEPVGKGFAGQVYAIKVAGEDVWVGGGFTSAVGETYTSEYLTKYSRAIAGDADINVKVSALSDTSNNVHVLYANTDGSVKYRKYTRGTGRWGSAIELYSSDNEPATSLSLGLDSELGQLHAFWTCESGLMHLPGDNPFSAGNWAALPSLIYGGGSNTYVSAQPYSLENRMMLSWTVADTQAETSLSVAPSAISYPVMAYVFVDSDGDGLLDHEDDDDDNDGLLDEDEPNYGTDPLDPDSDNDGVKDGQEVADGSDPLDEGSNIPVLSSTLCTEWNGFLGGMWNVFEHVNMSVEAITVESTLYDINGAPQSVTAFVVQPGSQYDLLAHGMDGWILNSYGKVCSTVKDGEDGQLDGRMVYYKEAPTSSPGAYSFEFAFAMPLLNGITGTQFVPFNTFQPSLDPVDAGNLVANWIQLTNLEEESQAGSLVFYGQDGTELGAQEVVLDGGARRDFSGHQFGANLVGICKWEPDDDDARFQLRNVRYLYDNPSGADSFDSAFQLEGLVGTGRSILVPLDTSSGSAIVEIGNALSSPATVEVKIFSEDGDEVMTESHALAGYGSVHVITDPILNGEKGSALISGPEGARYIAVAMQYERSATLGIEFLYGIPAKEPLGTVLKSSYNTFLGQGCRLLAVNGSDSAAKVNISMVSYDGTPVLPGREERIPAHGLLDYDLCYNDVADRYGVVTVQPVSVNSVVASVVRVGSNNSYAFPTPARQ